MLTIGFKNHYYTLWSVTETERWSSEHQCTYIITHYRYWQNLSMDHEAAKAKIAAMAGDAGYEEDLSLCGDGKYFTKTRIANMDLFRFTFGQLIGKDMRVCDDVWQLNRAVQKESNPRRRVYARRRLIELGEMVKFAWEERTVVDWDFNIDAMDHDTTTPIYDIKYKYTHRSWCPKKLYQFKMNDKLKGHFYQDGSRNEMKLIRVGKVKEFESQFGKSYIANFKNDQDQMFKYMGAALPEIGTEEFVACKATVKHEEYRGQKETKIQRIKIITAKIA